MAAPSDRSNGEILAGGGDTNNSFIVEEIKPGNASDKRPDEFANARANSIKIDTNGGIHLAYFDAATTHLVYDARNPNGVWDTPTVIDNGANAGQYVSLALNSKNNPGIAYFDGNAGDLKFALWNGSTWHTEIVDSKGSVGLYPSFTFDTANEPVVTYFNKTKGKLTFALKKENVTWGYENVDGSGDNVGRSSSLVASPKTGRYAVAYVDNTTGSVMWAGHQKGGTWDVKVAAKTKGGADFLSMAFGYYYEPMISYYDAFAADLKITSFFNNQFNIKTLATSGAGLVHLGPLRQLLRQRVGLRVQPIAGQDHALRRRREHLAETSDVVTGGGKYLSVANSGTDTISPTTTPPRACSRSARGLRFKADRGVFTTKSRSGSRPPRAASVFFLVARVSRARHTRPGGTGYKPVLGEIKPSIGSVSACPSG